jgi:NADPH:quinone reductase-like Zn-dependent oxidoreductase
MKQTTLPRIPCRDFAGVVEAGPTKWIGAEVWGAGGDTGLRPRRLACRVHCLTFGEPVPEARSAQLPAGASVGVNYMAAWCGLEAAGLRASETVLLIGASGSVGNAAAQIAQRLGTRQIAVDQRPSRRRSGAVARYKPSQ